MNEEQNPFKKKMGLCSMCILPPEETNAVRIYYCHFCGKYFCWKCLKKHEE